MSDFDTENLTLFYIEQFYRQLYVYVTWSATNNLISPYLPCFDEKVILKTKVVFQSMIMHVSLAMVHAVHDKHDTFCTKHGALHKAYICCMMHMMHDRYEYDT